MPSLLSLFYLTPHVLQTRIIFNTNIELVLFSRTLLFSQTELVSSVSIVLPVHLSKMCLSFQIPPIYVSSDKLEHHIVPHPGLCVCVYYSFIT